MSARKATVHTAALVGIDASIVTVTAEISEGLPGFYVEGLAEAAVRETRVRVQAAIGNAGIPFPAGRITVTLDPVHVRKDSAGVDLPIALAILGADGQIPPDSLDGIMALGELSLAGDVRPVRGALASFEAAVDSQMRTGIHTLLVAPENGAETATIESDHVTPRTVRTLHDAIAHVRGEARAPQAIHVDHAPDTRGADFIDVRGQGPAKRAAEIAATGDHAILLVGVPGAGKTMLARRIPSILPPMTDAERFEVMRVHSAAGLTIGGGLVHARPFRAPHHSTTAPGLVGGGAGAPRPGEVTLAHRGVLFLDEIPEFQRATMEAIRVPLATGEVVLARAHATVRYPARVLVVGASNPCPCGHAGSTRRTCRCLPRDVARFRTRIPDVFDMRIEIPPVDLAELDHGVPGESSETIRARVVAARAHRRERQGDVTNAALEGAALLEHARPDDEGRARLLRAVADEGLSARTYERVLRIARSIADLALADRAGLAHVDEALTLVA